MKDEFSKCGIKCSRCLAFKENSKNEETKKRCSYGWEKYLDAHIRIEIINCEGCQSPNPWERGNILPDRGCYIRPCVIKNKIITCAYCSLFPCEELLRRIPDENFRKKIEDRIGEKMPVEDYHDFIEPYEGIKYLKEIRDSLSADEIVIATEISPLKAKIVDFPLGLQLSKKEIKSFKNLYDILKNLLIAKSKTYARQVLLKRRKNHMLGLLWVLGLYGEFKNKKESSLLLDGSIYGSKKECSWLIRKYDNKFHSTIREAVFLFQDFGIKIELAPLKKSWIIKLSIKEKVGGKETLKALKIYTNKLTSKYGEPVYAGNSRFKGRAFQLFSKADMEILKNEN